MAFLLVLCPATSMYSQQATSDEEVLEKLALSELSKGSIQRLNAMFIREYVARADTLEKQFKEITKKADSIRSVTEELFDGEIGKKLGTRLEVIRAFIAFEEIPLVTTKEIGIHYKRIEPIRQGIIEYASVPQLFRPSNIPEIEKLYEEQVWANAQQRVIENRIRKLDTFLQFPSEKISADGLPTLRERVKSVKNQMLQLELEVVGAAREKGQREGIAETAQAARIRELEIGKQKAENELRMMRLEIEKLQAEFKLLEAKKQAVIQETNQQVSAREKLTRLEDKEILGKLRPFTASGY